jgi:GTP-dependent dephospho-CoA kinase
LTKAGTGSGPASPAAASPDLRPAKRYVLPESLRKELAAPFGPILQSEDLSANLKDVACIIAVGDVVSLTLKILKITPRLFVCDYQTQRGMPAGRAAQGVKTAPMVSHETALYESELGSWGDISFTVRNPAASITRQAWDAVRIGLAAEEGPVRIHVEGEEDLLGIPCFLEAPDGAVVLYGMPNQGVVSVTVDAAFKARVAALLARFERQ